MHASCIPRRVRRSAASSVAEPVQFDGRSADTSTLRIFSLDADGVSQNTVVEDVVAPVGELTITLPAASDEQPAGFTDVPAGHPFHDEIAWMVGEQFTSGFPNGTTLPGEEVTSQAIAAIAFPT